MIMNKTITIMITTMTIQDTWYIMMHDGHSIYGAAWPKAQNL